MTDDMTDVSDEEASQMYPDAEPVDEFNEAAVIDIDDGPTVLDAPLFRPIDSSEMDIGDDELTLDGGIDYESNRL